MNKVILPFSVLLQVSGNNRLLQGMAFFQKKISFMCRLIDQYPNPCMLPCTLTENLRDQFRIQNPDNQKLLQDFAAGISALCTIDDMISCKFILQHTSSQENKQSRFH
jgi:hypothetical protein